MVSRALGHSCPTLQAVLEIYALHDIDIRPHVLLALVLYKLVDQVPASCMLLIACSADALACQRRSHHMTPKAGLSCET
jgi:hypothetical protein